MSKVIVVLSHKGGCGKSETVLNLAYGLAQKGKKVLVVDGDPQCNVTSILMSELPLSASESDFFLNEYTQLQPEQSQFLAAYQALKKYVEMNRVNYDIHHVLEGECPVEEAIYSTRYENINIIPSGTELSMTDYQLKNKSLEPYRALRMALDKVRDQYDVILMDNQPFKNALTFNAIAACVREGDMVLIPTKINRGGLEGTYETMETIMEWLRSESLPLDIRLLATMVNRNNIDKSWIEALRKAFGNRMFQTTIRYQAKPVEDASMRKRILLEAYKKGVAEDYQSLVNELDALE
ncbi:ParA family protein [Faecalitalea cylindroides]|uniref:ParA family protein n=1 Tax=Faecalitalea cylindroides TaxID=39483 RepID=A0AAW6FST7_9FIRM|nr:ParA family protein [Faecalitalea cylindroides]MDC0827975.1 ParA family protein [Faecalitalea cylindroides]